MNGKQAKRLRKAAYSIPDLPDVECTEVNIQEGPKLYIGPDGPTLSEPVRSSTIELKPHCRRAWYKSMKRSHNNGNEIPEVSVP